MMLMESGNVCACVILCIFNLVPRLYPSFLLFIYPLSINLLIIDKKNEQIIQGKYRGEGELLYSCGILCVYDLGQYLNDTKK